MEEMYERGLRGGGGAYPNKASSPVAPVAERGQLTCKYGALLTSCSTDDAAKLVADMNRTVKWNKCNAVRQPCDTLRGFPCQVHVPSTQLLWLQHGGRWGSVLDPDTRGVSRGVRRAGVP